MIHRFDHIVIAVQNLADAEQIYGDRLGLDVYPGGRHTGRGTQNAIVRFGLDYLELLSVVDANEARNAGMRRSALVDYLENRAGGLAGYCLAATDLDRLAEHFRTTGLDALGPYDMERQRPDGLVLRWRLLVPGGLSWRRPWPFFIQWEMPDAQRMQYETPGLHELGARRAKGVSVLVRDLDAAKHLYAHHFGLTLATEDNMPDLSSARARFSLPDGFTIDLLMPEPASPLQAAMASDGEGLHDIVLAVADLRVAQDLLATRGIAVSQAPGRPLGCVISADNAVGARIVLEAAG